jgi:hypothetical protein
MFINSALIRSFVFKNISIALATNFNISMETMKSPESWKEANVTPILKKGPTHLVENDRPISLTSIVCKTMEPGTLL